jgi:arginyl-tRNA synthetase
VRAQSKHLVRDDHGALVADVAGAPLVIRKQGASCATYPRCAFMCAVAADGSYLYSTTDLAAVAARSAMHRVLYVVDASQVMLCVCVFVVVLIACVRTGTSL